MYLKSITFNTERFPTRDVYPFNIPVFQATQRIELSSPVTILVGQNGSGKSASVGRGRAEERAAAVGREQDAPEPREPVRKPTRQLPVAFL